MIKGSDMRHSLNKSLPQSADVRQGGLGMYDVVPLHLMSPGSVAEVVALQGHPEQVRRLEELGLRHGAQVEMVRGGSPCIIRLSSGKLCFRHSEALRVLVRPFVP
jgi:ferrous iron transport protein A